MLPRSRPRLRRLSWPPRRPFDPYLAAYYNGVPGSGAILYDESPQGNHGTIEGAVWADGVIRPALHFDGLDDYVKVASPTGLPSGDVAKTIEAWFKSTDLSTLVNIGGFGINQIGKNFQVGVEVAPSDYFYVWGWGNDWSTSIPSAPYADDKWHHVAVTYDGTVRFYLDGVLGASTTAYVHATDPQKIVIGNEIDEAGQPFLGEIAEFRIYGRALSRAEVLREYLRLA